MTSKTNEDAAIPTPKISRFAFLDNIHTTVFTPSEFQVEVLDAAKEKNIVICLATLSSKSFILVMLVKEFSSNVTKQFSTKRCWVLANNAFVVQQYFDLIFDHTNLEVVKILDSKNVTENTLENVSEITTSHQVVVTSMETFLEAVEERQIDFNQINLLIVDECHLALTAHPCRKLMSLIPHKNCQDGPRVVGLSISVLDNTCDPEILERRLLQLERCTRCVSETSSNLMVVSRFSSRPEEMVIVCRDADVSEVEREIREVVLKAKEFLLDHVYEPAEIYGDDGDDFASIPDPAATPLTFLSDLIDILDTLGAWCADRAAWFFMKELKKQRDKTPYERHYLLISVAFTVMETVRGICDHHFRRHADEKQRMLHFVTPKVLRLLEILRFYKPPAVKEEVHHQQKGCEINLLCDGADHVQTFNCISDSVHVHKCAFNTAEFERGPSTCSTFDCCCSRRVNNQRCDFHTDQNGRSALGGGLSALGAVAQGHNSSATKQIGEPGKIRSSFSSLPYKFGGSGRNGRHFNNQATNRGPNQRQFAGNNDPNSLWGIIFVEKRYAACILNMYLKEMSKQDPFFNFVAPNFIMGQRSCSFAAAGKPPDPTETQMEHRKQEEVLRRFRMHESNVLVATSVVEDGVDLPKCNLVVRFSPPQDYKSYAQSKGRAKAIPSRYLLLVENKRKQEFLKHLEKFRGVEEVLLSRCNGREIPVDEEIDLRQVDEVLPPYFPNRAGSEVHVKMSSAISVVNRYCARLPSDTFTRLVPRCKIQNPTPGSFQATLQLPINSPVKETIRGPSMQNPALAKLAVALETCKVLHRSGELDDNLMPMGKISAQFQPEPADEEEEFVAEGMPRPGTTKRRQYYNKRIANAFKNCLPSPGILCRLYFIHMKLTCAIPEEQNIRGRQIYQPSDTSQGFGILVAGGISEICGFPVFTRSGEVAVKLRDTSCCLYLTETQLDALFYFHHYTFASVLRLEKYPMCYDKNEAENSILVVPVVEKLDEVSIDWNFVQVIVAQRDVKPSVVSEQQRNGFQFDCKTYQDAVVMPWYRNLDQPQYFYVAEICYHLTPQSDFPDDDFETFEKYYLKKYGIKIMNLEQPLLDVDHTSARLNLLTPRYVNRKGVALPTISEETKRAKRENLQQKQILVPELCSVHPFSASLWRKAVCLPCILYRLNSLLLADELRLEVASEIGLGKMALEKSFSWPALDFGWGLSDVIKHQKQRATSTSKSVPSAENDRTELKKKNGGVPKSTPGHNRGKSGDNVVWEPPNNSGVLNNSFSIGTWTNEMALEEDQGENDYEQLNENEDEDLFLDDVMMMINGGDNELDATFIENGDAEYQNQPVRYGSPSNFEANGWDIDNDEFGQNFKNIPGFGFISAPGGFNMDDLSRDLEALEEADPTGATARNYRSHQMKNRMASKNVANGSLGEDTEEEDDEDDFEEEDEEEEEEDGNLEQAGSVGFWRSERNEKSAKHNNGNVWDSDECGDASFGWDEVDDGHLQGAEVPHNRPVPKNVLIRVVEAGQNLQLERVKSVQEQIGGLVNAAGGSSCHTKLINKGDEVNKDGCDTFLSHPPTNSVRVLDVDVNKYSTTSLHVVDNKAVIFESTDSTLNDHPVVMTTINNNEFSFDYQPDLGDHPGPSPSLILQALTMSNANDGINLERLETIGDSFLKHAITTYLFCTYPAIHEGKLSHLRSKQVSNLKLYRLGRRKGFAHSMVATKFEPNDNWLPPGYVVPKELEQALIDSGIPAGYWNIARLPDLAKWRDLDSAQIREVLAKHGEEFRHTINVNCELKDFYSAKPEPDHTPIDLTCFIPYNLMSQHSIPDKSIADCVEAQIGAYLTSCGQRGALLLMSWLGINILPKIVDPKSGKTSYGHLNLPPSPLQVNLPDWKSQLDTMLIGYDEFENRLGYKFRDRSYLLQAFTHASYHYNRLTDCYQRLEFLGDAVLDYLITRHLYEDKRQHSPGTLTDLRSALVNNTIFATLAVRYDFHKYFKAFCPNLFLVIDRFVRMQKENDHKVNEEYYFIEEDECEEVEDIEVPKALGDVFESLAGAIYLDSGMSLDIVWRVYYAMMKPEIELFSASVPKSPIRELLEKEPETAKFGKPERTLDGKVRVTVEVFGKGRFTALGRNYRIAKCTAAKHALKALRKLKPNAEGS